MFDEIQQLREDVHLLALLAYYQAGATDREGWLDRLDRLDGAEAKDLVRLHGQLIAHGWVEQNTGNTPGLRPGVVSGCYRIATAGARALKRAQSLRDDDEGSAHAA
jgi:hypothetical protein